MTRAVLADTGPLYAAADEGDDAPSARVEELKELARAGREVVVAYPILLEAYSLRTVSPGQEWPLLTWLTYMTDAVFINPTPEDYRQAFAKSSEAYGSANHFV